MPWCRRQKDCPGDYYSCTSVKISFKTTAQWADEFGVSYQTILKMAEVIRKEDKTLCPKIKPKPRTREGLAKAGVALFRKKQGKK